MGDLREGAAAATAWQYEPPLREPQRLEFVFFVRAPLTVTITADKRKNKENNKERLEWAKPGRVGDERAARAVPPIPGRVAAAHAQA